MFNDCKEEVNLLFGTLFVIPRHFQTYNLTLKLIILYYKLWIDGLTYSTNPSKFLERMRFELTKYSRIQDGLLKISFMCVLKVNLRVRLFLNVFFQFEI